MKDYIAWLNGASVARGTLAQVRAKAIEIFKSEGHKETILRITRGSGQYFVSSEVLKGAAR